MVKERWCQRFMVAFVIGIAALAVGVPLVGAGNCAGGFCLVPAAGVSASAIIADGPVDDYWRDEPQRATVAPSAIGQPLVDSRGSSQAVRAATGTFDWGDFGIGIGVAVGSMLVLAGLGAGVLVFALGHGRGTSSAGTA